MKKKIVAIMLMASLAIASVACGSTKEIEPATNESSVEESSVEESVEETTEEADEADSEEEAKEVSEEEVDDSEFTSGVINGNVYENMFFDVTYTIQDDMRFATEDELALLSGAMSDLVDDEATKSQLDNGQTVIVAYALNADNTKTFNVTMSSLNVFGSLLSEKTLVDMSIEQAMPTLEQMYQNVEVSTEEMEIMGETHYVANMSMEMNGVQLYQRQMYIIKGSYVSAYTCATTDLAELDKLYEGFAKYND
ncbi:hypothetical protein [Butyrivibrio proteoclasticus]|uniref:hypothetical protein n=1 Tax=Butyrivibrio proteoclasticus TaxID=43305 RepID=UPI00047CA79F|nr:hypothetical protein [Butyrivibrio proteoclasticus]